MTEHPDDPGESIFDDPSGERGSADASWGGHHSSDHRGHTHAPGSRRAARKRGSGCVPVTIGLIAVLVLGFFGVRWGMDKVEGLVGGPPDYTGTGTSKVTFEVHKGDTSAEIGRALKSAGVVKSVDAFMDAARAEPESRNIQVGFYPLKKKLPAKTALAVLIDPKNLVQDVVTVPEGARVRDIVKRIVARTDLKRADLTAALADPDAIGLPAIARGNPEGYLYPATYNVMPKMTAVDLLKQMVAKTLAVEKDLDIEARAKARGMTPEQILTLASILEYEANRDQDYPKVARVFYNRLDQGMPLQSDATVSYASGREGDVWTTAGERASDSAYNTYKHTGLPPGPIGSPGEKTIEAALEPASGDWLYFVPDFENGTTLFTDSYAQHQRNVAKARVFCRTSDKC